MKKFIMVAIVVAAALTLGFRCLSPMQQKNILAQVPARFINIVPAASAVEPKKYKLVATENRTLVDATSPPNFLDRNEHAQRTLLPLVASAFIQHLENIQVQDEGRVIKLLADDTDGNKHQRFLVRTNEDVTVLIAHNLNIAPRINDLAMGDRISFAGEYVWNEKGGVVHWTHHDPQGHHQAGWIQHNGTVYR